MTSEKRRKGDEGEEVAFLYLKKNGYTILERNYKTKYGELDLIATLRQARGKKVVVFVEVKSQGQGVEELYPELHVDRRKQRHLIRASQAYLLNKKCPDDTDWQIDVIGVTWDPITQKPNVRHTQNAVFQ